MVTDYSTNLAIERSGGQRLINIEGEARMAGIIPPSKIKYLFLRLAAGVGDVLDLASTFGLLTGIGAVVTVILFFVDLFITIVFLFFSWRTGKKIKKMRKFNEGLDLRINQLNDRIASIRKIYATAIRQARKIKFLRKPVRKLALRLGRLRKNIMGRAIIVSLMDMRPTLEVLPWRSLAVHSMHKEEKRLYEEAKNSLIPELLSATAENETLEQEMAEIEASQYQEQYARETA